MGRRTNLPFRERASDLPFMDCGAACDRNPGEPRAALTPLRQAGALVCARRRRCTPAMQVDCIARSLRGPQLWRRKVTLCSSCARSVCICAKCLLHHADGTRQTLRISGCSYVPYAMLPHSAVPNIRLAKRCSQATSEPALVLGLPMLSAR